MKLYFSVIPPLGLSEEFYMKFTKRRSKSNSKSSKAMMMAIPRYRLKAPPSPGIRFSS